jgi:Fe-S-cluster-containing dehydrogenase component
MEKRNDENVNNRASPSTLKSPFGLDRMTRRDFLKLAGIAGVGTAGFLIPQVVCVPMAEAGGTTNPYPANAKGMVVAEPSRCTGCRRCELACSEFNDGKASPTISRIKVSRNLNFGPEGAQTGFWRGQGQFGNFRIVQDTCRQCGHPVPCQLACPNGAIEVIGPVNARIVNVSKCTGCKICQAACPWGMTSFDAALNKATKCTLCDGNPECVKACPTGALQYVPWQNKARDIPARWVVPSYLSTPADVANQCGACHK